MIIKKYSQSCLFIETNNLNILIDPGTLKFKKEYIEEWGKANIILITHRHADHINEEVIKDFNIPIYSLKKYKMLFQI